jgi:hypothetical protein
MSRIVKPTDAATEQEKGRIALWLDPEDLRWLAQHCGCPPGVSPEVTERCGRIRFRANAALHKAGPKRDAEQS